jgi:hypothetical protein
MCSKSAPPSAHFRANSQCRVPQPAGCHSVSATTPQCVTMRRHPPMDVRRRPGRPSYGLYSWCMPRCKVIWTKESDSGWRLGPVSPMALVLRGRRIDADALRSALGLTYSQLTSHHSRGWI